MTDPWGVPQTGQPQDPQSSGTGYPQQGPYGAPPQFGAPAPGQQPQPQQPQFGGQVPQQPQYDPNLGQSQQQPQFGGQVPQQPQYDPNFGQQPQFGGDPSMGGMPGPYDYPGGMPPKQSNGLALAGAITCFIPVVGLVLSIIGRVRAKALGGAGKTAGTVGIVLSVLFLVGYGFAGFEIGNSTALDPGCLSAEAGMSRVDGALVSDDQALSSAEQSQDQTAMQAAANKFISDVKTAEGTLTHAESLSIHANVKAAITKANTDLQSVVTEFQQVENGDSSAASQLETTANSLTADGTALDNLCGNATNG
jgi:hypothetical protein